ncbi:MAG: HAD-IIIC family phosphatase [Nitrospina sp.]|jgi:FkbH-like protein|nr:HAD-IIIC family phosphatase [Nitrospina sp.]MBT3856451.1 HAD-IIIC family phosphatase [Nitrospina sp.]MBT4105648.1 HAD-IIIC family phosphatase [Nitrospina sp.]MBT4389448.1 HAD-IIIC family phosphatase [Nitrospina sp.]MBT4620876.1 HAD-IIIC family phosphatase [Nitrospina sp.]
MAKPILKSDALNPSSPEGLDPATRAEMELTAGCQEIRFLVERGYLSMAREKLEEVFSKGRQIKNHHLVEPAIVLLQAYEKNKQYQSANELFKQYESILGESQVALTLAGSSCLNLNDSQQAENFLEGAIQKDSSYPDPYLLLGDLYAKSQPDKAVSYYSQYYDLRSSIMGARIFIKRVKSLLKTNSLSFKNLSIAFIGNFTIEPIKDFLEAECFKQSIQPKFYFGGYDQYIQEMADANSGLFNFDPAITFLFLDSQTLSPELFNKFFDILPEKRFHLAEDKLKHVEALCNKFLDLSKSHLVVSNFLLPSDYYMGVYDSKMGSGQKEILGKMNDHLLSQTRSNPQRFHILDTEKVLSNCGKTTCANEKMRYLAKMIIPDQALPDMARELMRFVRPVGGKTKKCLVLDLDNTLWGGILGEEGLEGIELGLEPPGNAFYEFQKAVKALQRRGIILAINSKNDPDLVREAFEKHPDMQLKLSDFACIRTNWNDKAQNLREIADELNLGLSSFVFFDDNPAERLLIRQQMPEVLTIEVPEDCSEYTRTLLSLGVFETLHLTEEDKNRTHLYQTEDKRRHLKDQATELDSYLESLKTQVVIQPADSFSIPRVAQLTQRTNQFNLTTQRYSEADIRAFAESEKSRVYFLKSGDRFGDHGIVGACIVRVENDSWELDTFLMSCRVIGRGIENAFLYDIFRKASEDHIKNVVGRYFPTRKNQIAESFYPDAGFETMADNPQEKVFTLNLEKNSVSLPSHIKMLRHEN